MIEPTATGAPCRGFFMPSTQGYIETADGIRLYFQSLGPAPNTVVLPNGFHLLDDFQRLANKHTLIFYDPRNRGRSDTIADPSKLTAGIHNDVSDLEAVRRHFGLDQISLIGHSYMGLMVALYAMRHPNHVNRAVMLGPTPPDASQQFPAALDDTLAKIQPKLAELQKERESLNPEEFCRKFWSILKPIYVVNPADAAKINWERCDLPNERNFMKYWLGQLLPSINKLRLTEDELDKATTPILIIHGVKDRSAPYGGAREWARRLPNARLLPIENAAHAPWIENPAGVFEALETCLNGAWPQAAQPLTR